MASDIFELSVESVEANTAVIHVQLVHPDGPEPTKSKTFALGALANPLCVSELSSEEIVQSSPIASFMDADQAQDEDFLSEFAEMFITDLEFEELPATGAKMAAGRYTITVYDALWLQQLGVGMRWTTTLWAFAESQPWKGERLAAGFYKPAPTEDATRGLRTIGRSEVEPSYLEGIDLEELTYATLSEAHFMRGKTLEEHITLEALQQFNGQPVLYEGFWGESLATLMIKNDGSLSFYKKSDGCEGTEGSGVSDLKYIAAAIPARRVFDEEATDDFVNFRCTPPSILEASAKGIRWKWGRGFDWDEVDGIEFESASEIEVSMKNSGVYYTYAFYRDFWTILSFAPEHLRAPIEAQYNELLAALGWCKVCGYRAFRDDTCVLCGNEAYSPEEHKDSGYESEEAYLRDWQEVHFRKIEEGYPEDDDRPYFTGPLPFEKSPDYEPLVAGS